MVVLKCFLIRSRDQHIHRNCEFPRLYTSPKSCKSWRLNSYVLELAISIILKMEMKGLKILGEQKIHVPAEDDFSLLVLGD